MKLESVTEGILVEARMVWKKSGNKVVRAVRCTAGPRRGRVVSTASQCSAPIDIKKKMQMKRTKSKMGTRMTRKARKTKRVNPASRRVRALNKR